MMTIECKPVQLRKGEMSSG